MQIESCRIEKQGSAGNVTQFRARYGRSEANNHLYLINGYFQGVVTRKNMFFCVRLLLSAALQYR